MYRLSFLTSARSGSARQRPTCSAALPSGAQRAHPFGEHASAMPILVEHDCVVCGSWRPAERWARRQITEWLPVGDGQPVCDECMMTSWQRQNVWDEPPGG
jgi:hypothetical protein